MEYDQSNTQWKNNMKLTTNIQMSVLNILFILKMLLFFLTQITVITLLAYFKRMGHILNSQKLHYISDGTLCIRQIDIDE